VLARLDGVSRVHALAELVRTSDYFTILGVDPAATNHAIDQAHHRLRSMIPTADLADDPETLRLAREVLRSLDEARDVLSVPQLRAAYRQHLKS
jgi:curved DNA-binding protein CbpA